MFATIRCQSRPWAFRRNGYARHIIGDDRAQSTPAALSRYPITCSPLSFHRRVGWVDLDEWLTFFGD
jgi:hypothetical protein